MSLVGLSVPMLFFASNTGTSVFAVFLVAFAGFGYFAGAVAAQKPEPKEYEVKAVYLYNFGRFVQWPDTAAKDESFAVCILGSDPFGAILDSTVANETIDNRKLTIAKRIAKPGDAAGCRILVIRLVGNPSVLRRSRCSAKFQCLDGKRHARLYYLRRDDPIRSHRQ